MRGKPEAVRKSIGSWAVVCAAMVLGMVGCVEPEREREHREFAEEGTYRPVFDDLEFTDEPYEMEGEIGIGDLRTYFQSTPPVWLAFAQGEEYPVPGDCDPQRSFDDTVPEYLAALPAVIEGVVTLHPRHFQKVSVCGTEERYYGSYIIQDATGGIQVLRDSRIGAFDIGDRVRIRVRALLRNFGSQAVLAYDQEELLTTPSTREAVYYEEIQRNFQENDDLYLVRRIRGRVTMEATNQNFNEMEVRPEGILGVRWLVSLDRELGTRGTAPPEGALVELTGPIVESFGLRMLVSNLGQMEIIEE